MIYGYIIAVFIAPIMARYCRRRVTTALKPKDTLNWNPRSSRFRIPKFLRLQKFPTPPPRLHFETSVSDYLRPCFEDGSPEWARTTIVGWPIIGGVGDRRTGPVFAAWTTCAGLIYVFVKVFLS